MNYIFYKRILIKIAKKIILINYYLQDQDWITLSAMQQAVLLEI